MEFGCLETGEISAVDSREITILLDRLNNVQSNAELTDFLNELSDKWPIFQPTIEQILQGSDGIQALLYAVTQISKYEDWLENIDKELDEIVQTGLYGKGFHPDFYVHVR